MAILPDDGAAVTPPPTRTPGEWRNWEPGDDQSALTLTGWQLRRLRHQLRRVEAALVDGSTRDHETALLNLRASVEVILESSEQTAGGAV